MGKTKPPEFLAIGHITKDLLPKGDYRLGGTAVYSALAAHRLGKVTALVTSAAPDISPQGELEGVELKVLPAPATTTFHNLYDRGGRRQWILAQATPISSEAIPFTWLGADIVLLGPVAREIGAEVSQAFAPSSLVAFSPQGIWRRWDEKGMVRTTPQKLGPEWRVEVLILSEEDIAEESGVLESLVCRVPICVVTEGARGATLYHAGCHCSFPARRTSICDPTGAGDVFAAAFLVRWRETGDAAETMSFANCAASLAIEAPGLSGIPTRQEVERAQQGGQR